MNWRNFGLVAAVIALVMGYQFYNKSFTKEAIGEPLAEVIVPALSGQALAGENAFNANCAACHGANAAGQDGVAPPLIHIIYEPNHHGDQSFVLAAKQGVRQHHWPFGNMPPVAEITDQEIQDVIAYIRMLQRANGIQ